MAYFIIGEYRKQTQQTYAHFDYVKNIYLKSASHYMESDPDPDRWEALYRTLATK